MKIVDINRSLQIVEWSDSHVRWSKLRQLIATLGQTRWAETEAEWHLSAHMLIALHNDVITGFLRFVTQVIGIDEDHDPVVLNGTPLIEAKVLAFGVALEHRNQGIGRLLQMAAIQLATHHGCYQLRSHSGGENEANHHLKLSMGFGVHPVIRGDDKRGVFFVMPLK